MQDFSKTEKCEINPKTYGKNFNIKKVMYAIVTIILAFLLGVVIYVHVVGQEDELAEISDKNIKANQSFDDVTKEGHEPIVPNELKYAINQTTVPEMVQDKPVGLPKMPSEYEQSFHEITEDEQDLNYFYDEELKVIPELKPDRIFFVILKENNGVITDEIKSVLADKTDFRSHDLQNSGEVPFPILTSNNEAQLFAYTTGFGSKAQITVKDWNVDSNIRLELKGSYPSFSVDGKKIVFSKYEREEADKITIITTDGTKLMETSLQKGLKSASFLFFTHDHEYIIFRGRHKDDSSEIYKLNISDPSKYYLISEDTKTLSQFIVSPIADQIICRYLRDTNEFYLVDFSDLKNVKSNPLNIHINKNEKLTLLSWSTNGKFVYMHKKDDTYNNESIVKFDLESQEFKEICKIPKE